MGGGGEACNEYVWLEISVGPYCVHILWTSTWADKQKPETNEKTIIVYLDVVIITLLVAKKAFVEKLGMKLKSKTKNKVKKRTLR